MKNLSQERPAICRVTDKLAYTTHLAAENVLRNMVRSKKWQRKAIRNGYFQHRAYYCEHCEGWHLTSQKRRSYENRGAV